MEQVQNQKKKKKSNLIVINFMRSGGFTQDSINVLYVCTEDVRAYTYNALASMYSLVGYPELNRKFAGLNQQAPYSYVYLLYLARLAGLGLDVA